MKNKISLTKRIDVAINAYVFPVDSSEVSKETKMTRQAKVPIEATKYKITLSICCFFNINTFKADIDKT